MTRTKNMTDDAQSRHQIVLSIIKSVTQKTALAVGIGVAAVLVYTVTQQKGQWWFMPGGVLFGGALGLLNFRWLAFAIERKLLKRIQPAGPSNPAIIILNVLKLAAIFIVLFVVIKWQMVNIFGLVVGLSLCFLAIVWEGLTVMSRVYHDNK